MSSHPPPISPCAGGLGEAPVPQWGVWGEAPQTWFFQTTIAVRLSHSVLLPNEEFNEPLQALENAEVEKERVIRLNATWYQCHAT